MAVLKIGTTPVMVGFRNPKRAYISAEMLPNSISSGNTGLVYGKFGSAPTASRLSNTYDFILNSGATGGTNLYQTRDRALITRDLWLVADTADQEVNVIEQDGEAEVAPSPSGAGAP